MSNQESPAERRGREQAERLQRAADEGTAELRARHAEQARRAARFGEATRPNVLPGLGFNKPKE